MSNFNQHEFTELLLAWGNGDQDALERLTTVTYSELHRLARRHMRGERAGHMLQTTALVNEAWLRLIDGSSKVHWHNRAHFLAMASKMMRRVLVDIARKRKSQKGSGGAVKVSLAGISAPTQHQSADILEIDKALEELKEDYPREAEVVEMSYFGGLKGNEIAHELAVSPSTVTKDLQFALMWLRRNLSSQG